MSPEFEAMSIRQRQDALIAALRSGEYEQGRGALKNKDGRFCCLGVSCNLAGLASENGEGGDYSYSFKTFPSKVYLPSYFDEEFGFYNWAGRSSNGDGSLASLNDEGKTFVEIADLLEPMDSPYWERAKPE